ncbi:hypothetical protein [Gottfriedia acidiceleris]|uniref:hypothetical protein n=1 Tax=Gottfriedia acidiceleris TaxID=371036 RepID=UPI003000AD2D
MREWTTDEIIYIIYKYKGVIRLGREEKFVDINFSETFSGKYKVSREEVIKSLKAMNEIILEEIENYYEMGLSITDVLQTEASEHGLTIEELLQPIFARKSLH